MGDQETYSCCRIDSIRLRCRRQLVDGTCCRPNCRSENRTLQVATAVVAFVPCPSPMKKLVVTVLARSRSRGEGERERKEALRVRVDTLKKTHY